MNVEKMREALELWRKRLEYSDPHGDMRVCVEALAAQPEQQVPAGLELHHIGAIERAAAILDARADEYLKAGDYSAELESGDAESLREVLAWISAQPEQRGEAVGWLTDQSTFHFDKTDAWNDSEGFIEPLYTAPPSPTVPDARPYPAVTAAMSQFNGGWNACRAAMLAAAPGPNRG